MLNKMWNIISSWAIFAKSHEEEHCQALLSLRPSYSNENGQYLSCA